MARRKSTPTFIVELPIVVPTCDEREMLVRLELARQLYNACLGEALRRLVLMRESKAYARARDLPRRIAGKPNKARYAAFLALRSAFGFASAAISAFGSQIKNDAKWNDGCKRTDPRLGAHETQRIAERAFNSVEMYALGVRGRPRFKGKHRPLRSLEGKSGGSSLCWNAGVGLLQWGELRLPAMMPPVGRDPWLSEALNARTKYARVIWRVIKGQRQWFVQLAQEGLVPMKYEVVQGKSGLDVGPSTVAVYSERGVALCPLAPEVVQPWKDVRRLQRSMDRSRRATNPECYNSDGTWKRGAKGTVRSKGYRARQDELAEKERVLAQCRERSHGALANQVLACGNILQSEKLNYKSFQKKFGRSTKVRGVGSLMALLRRKAERAGGQLQDLNTWRLKLSQYDHVTGTCTKKPLSLRWHALGDGSGVVQRDLYSAFLAAAADVDALHPSRIEKMWPAAQSLLGRAGWLRSQPVSVAGLLATAPSGFGLPTPEPVARQRALARGDTSEVVGASREPKGAAGDGLRTPGL